MDVDLSFEEKDIEELKDVLKSNDFSPKKLLSILKRYFKKEYDTDAGVWEGYTIEGHTLMVLQQFEKYYQGKTLPGKVDKGLFRVILALHDLGKYKAIKKGDKKLQNKYNLKILVKVLRALNYKEKTVRLAKEIVKGDPIGELIKGQKNEVEIAEYLREVSGDLYLSSREFLKLKLIYYKADASSYTEDAGGKRSLDHLFFFDHKAPKLMFSRKTGKKVDKLRELFKKEI